MECCSILVKYFMCYTYNSFTLRSYGCYCASVIYGDEYRLTYFDMFNRLAMVLGDGCYVNCVTNNILDKFICTVG